MPITPVCVWAPVATEDRRGVTGHEGAFNDTKRCSSRATTQDMGRQGCSSCGTTENTPETLPKQENPCNKAQCGSCIPMMPPKHDRNSDMHPAPIRRSRVDDAMTYLWGSTLPFGMGIHCRIHLWSHQCKSPQRQLESSYSPFTSSASCAKQDPFGWCHTLQNQKRPHSRISSRPKRHIQSIHCGHRRQHSKPKKRALLLALGSAAQEVSEIEPLSHDNMETQPKSWMVIGFLSDDHLPPRQQIPCLRKKNFGNAAMKMDIKGRARNKCWMMGPPWTTGGKSQSMNSA